MTSKTQLQNRAVGCFLGLAVGDAFGDIGNAFDGAATGQSDFGCAGFGQTDIQAHRLH